MKRTGYEPAYNSYIKVVNESEFNGRYTAKQAVDACLQTLDKYDREMVEMRYGIGEYEGKPYTLKQLGELYGVSNVTISNHVGHYLFVAANQWAASLK